ncbi:fam-a protein [Plasmodium vinckei brucechwatti]|uniref:Fam-a protein n=1 Tax=Plasmodium vinckei brucechwatti TaxID=119398 RepID=A0A6V7T2P9_PLAVN|nr:fam-a protein [Plasmodium vinckei brucechwatti]
MNKGYIKIVFCLLNMLACIIDNVLASGWNTGHCAIQKPYLFSTNRNNTATRKQIPQNNPNSSFQINKKGNDLSRTNSVEIKNANLFMDEASTILQQFASNNDDYNLFQEYGDDVFLYFKKNVNPDIGKLNFKIPVPDAYEDIINMLWDPNAPRNYFDEFVNGKIVRTYDPNLVMIQHRYKCRGQSEQIYFHALFKKAQISEDTTIIVMASANINDRYPFNKEYKNDIIKGSSLFKADIPSDNDIRNGKLIKMFVRISGFVIKKEDKYVDITHIDSVNFNCHFTPRIDVQNAKAMKMLNVVKLKQIFDK